MDEKSSVMVISQHTTILNLCPMFFSVSFAFFTLGLLPKDPQSCNTKWSEIQTRMLKGSAHLLGLLAWRVQTQFDLVQKLECAQKQILELKKRRSEEAKANEKVMCIFAAREQSWFDERRQLQHQIDVLTNNLRLVRTKMEESVSGLSRKLEECKVVLQMREKLIEEMEERMRASEGKLKEAEKHIETKTQRCFQIENEIVRAFREVEEAKRELDLMKEQKEQFMLANEILAVDLVNDKEQKDEVLVLLRAVTSSNKTNSKSASCNDVFKQLRLKDEKLEAFQWRLIRMELESRRFQLHIHRLEHDISQLRSKNLKLETIQAEKGLRKRVGWMNLTHESSSPVKEAKEVSIISSTNMDIHSLATSYKIKRLKQQLMMLAGTTTENELLSTLNKQVDQYQSLQRRIDHLCKRMHENRVDLGLMEQFQEETFQLQRYIVATGQKLMEVQINGLGGIVEKHGNIDMKQFGDSIRGLVKEVQRGLEVQMSRIIGDHM